jgi:hypothetical protein
VSSPSDHPVKGIDVSKWQSTTPSLTGLRFLIARASIGTAPDVRYQMHIANARKAGLLVGAYHFNWDTSVVSVAAQAQAFLKAAGKVDFYFIDVEAEHAFTKAETAKFIDVVQAAGIRIGLYHSLSGYFEAGQDYDWVAKWSSTSPNRPWDFWQHRGSPLDLNVFNGTLAQLRRLSNLYVPPPPPPPPTEDISLAKSFTVPESPLILAELPAGAVLYSTSDLKVALPPLLVARRLAYVGQYSVDPDIRIVALEPLDEDVNVSSTAVFVPRASIQGFLRPTLLTTDEFDAAVSELRAIVASLETRLEAAKTAARVVLDL